MDAIADAARHAPQSPGVYFMLSAERELVYIGKATNLRRRLQQHAKAATIGATARDVERRVQVADVRWELTATEAGAADREADLVTALAPALNASLATDGTWTFIDVEVDLDGSHRAVTFSTTTDAESSPDGRRYGCFPHLGPGGSSRRSDACTRGYVAFLRLVWAAGEPDERARHAASIAGPSAAARRVTLPLPQTVTFAAVARFFGGGSSRILNDLRDAALAIRPPVMHPGVTRDVQAASGFYEHGPQVVRALKRRHGLASMQPITREAWIAALRTEVEEIVGGAFSVVEASSSLEQLVGGRRARAIAQRSRRGP